MRTSALEYLACPVCHGNLVADADPPSPDGHIMSGILVCGCGSRYPIRKGVPRLLVVGAANPDEDTQRVPSPFGTNWSMMEQTFSGYEQHFLDCLTPLKPRDFTNQAVLHAGCRAGGQTPIVARYGARAVVALEPSADVELAFAATRHLGNAHVVQGAIAEPPLARTFDLAFSIGAIGHLADPRAGFLAIADRVVSGGSIAISLSSYEANEWMARVLDPIRRKLTSRLPQQLAYWASLAPAVALAATLQIYRSRILAEYLPHGTYLNYISWYPLRKVHLLFFEKLTAAETHYLKQEELRRWFETGNFSDARISWLNRRAWRASARVIGHTAEARANTRTRMQI